jgi:hypothetical protein
VTALQGSVWDTSIGWLLAFCVLLIVVEVFSNPTPGFRTLRVTGIAAIIVARELIAIITTRNLIVLIESGHKYTKFECVRILTGIAEYTNCVSCLQQPKSHERGEV